MKSQRVMQQLRGLHRFALSSIYIITFSLECLCTKSVNKWHSNFLSALWDFLFFCWRLLSDVSMIFYYYKIYYKILYKMNNFFILYFILLVFVLPLRILFFYNETELEWIQIEKLLRKNWEKNLHSDYIILYSNYIIL